MDKALILACTHCKRIFDIFCIYLTSIELYKCREKLCSINNDVNDMTANKSSRFYRIYNKKNINKAKDFSQKNKNNLPFHFQLNQRYIDPMI
ncbi:hypothetical protein DERP_010744 [Dermatophagoides pteronyssinus]|uniref:Uncharacterized protein n=1 Tax=Dermatophagoides pteronyssinus TaxID=6956 RepID=A0ABQ8J6K4_DERPT|nr:hypothetical protein DERP_010744 [Dermatophagoides pteronyssinus]